MSASSSGETTGTYRQQRRHFTPRAGFTWMNTSPSDSLHLAVSGSAGTVEVSLVTSTSEVMNSIGSTSRYRSRSDAVSPDACSETRADSDVPTVLCFRSRSSSTLTASLIASSLAHPERNKVRVVQGVLTGCYCRCSVCRTQEPKSNIFTAR